MSFLRLAPIGTLFLAALLSIEPVTAIAQEQPVSNPAELTRLMSNQTANITHRNGTRQTVYMRADGTGKSRVDGQQQMRDVSWRVQGGMVCHDFSTPAKCYRVMRSGGAFTLISEDGAWRPSYRFVRGNPAGL